MKVYVGGRVGAESPSVVSPDFDWVVRKLGQMHWPPGSEIQSLTWTLTIHEGTITHNYTDFTWTTESHDGRLYIERFDVEKYSWSKIHDDWEQFVASEYEKEGTADAAQER